MHPHPFFLLFFLVFFAFTRVKANPYKIGHIGGVIDERSFVGKEQKLAMEMAIKDFNLRSSTCLKLVLHLENSQGKSARAVSAAIELVKHKKVRAIVGALTLQEAAIVSDFSDVTRNIPIIILNPTLSPPQMLQPQSSSIIQMSHDITIQMQCLANIIGHFGWNEVTAIYEQRYSFSMDLELVTKFSDSLKPFDAVVQNYIAFPPLSSPVDPESLIQEELKKLKQKSNRVFVILQSSIDFAVIFFKKAKEAGFMGKGYVWIISDDITSYLESIDQQSLIQNMQGVIGYKIDYFEENSKPFRDFRLRFRKKYVTYYSEEEAILCPTANAYRSYDAILAIAKSITKSEEKNNSKELVQQILSSEFQGASGKVGFMNGSLCHEPIFSIVNVIGNSYRKVATWSLKNGLLEEHAVHWPGDEQTIPEDRTFVDIKKQLQIGYPKNSVFEMVKNFSVNVFDAAVNNLTYKLHYELIPRNCSYDDLVKEVQNKSLDGAIGDITILADRFEWAEFSMPFVESSIVMIVPSKPSFNNEKFIVMKAFKLETWLVIAAMNLFAAMVIYLNENSTQNPDFQKASLLQHINSLLWLSITMLPFAQRQQIKHNLSRLVMAVWIGVILVAGACFTAVLSTMMTAPRLQPSITNINDLLKSNAPVGCNNPSFIGRYLKDVLGFKNVRTYNSSDQYPDAFRKKEITAVFLATPHSQVFLAQNCKGYIVAAPSWKFGGMGYAFGDSRLAKDISAAILRITQNGTINDLENKMLSLCKCSSSSSEDPALGLVPFSGVLFISGTVCVIVFIIATARLVERRWSIYGATQSLLISTRVCRWSAVLLAQWYMKDRFKFFKRPILLSSNIIHREIEL